MNTNAPTDYLAEIADNRYFVLGAYFFAFFPWAVMSNIDFMSEKWRTIRRTRKLAYIHLLSSIVPVVYVAAYAEAQRRVDDSKEYGAALTAVGFNLMHLMRTIMGIVQLDAFVMWCEHAVECILALQRRREGDTVENDQNVEETIKVNNTVVDNELGGTDLTVTPSWAKIWNGLKKGEFRPSACLVTDQAKLCTVRWSGALLCGVDRHLSVSSNIGREVLDLFFSLQFINLRRALQSVTWNIGGENCDFELLSIRGLEPHFEKFGLSGEMSTAYGTEIPKYFTALTFNSYSFEFDSLTSSYPSNNDDYQSDNREKVSVGLVESVVLAKHLGVEKLKEIRRYFNHCRFRINSNRQHAVKLLMKQLMVQSSDNSKLLTFFLSETRIPIFPYRMQIVALWDVATNWRVLQASAHEDIFNSWNLSRALNSKMSLFQEEIFPDSAFDYCAAIAKDSGTKHHHHPCSLGLVIETVRTFLAKWLVGGAREPDWEPAIPIDCFEFILSKNYSHNKFSLIWACQTALQKEVARTCPMAENLPSNYALIMLFLFGFPVIDFCEVDSDLSKSQHAVQQSGTSPANHSSVDVSVRVWRVSTVLAPQDISVVIRHDLETRKISMRLENNGDGTQFIWQNWVDAAMGYLKGFEEGADSELKYERTILRSDLRDPIVELCPLSESYDGSVKKTNVARIWMGWPPFDVHICKFEVEQWLSACRLGVLFFSGDLRVEPEVKNAEQLIEFILSMKNDEV